MPFPVKITFTTPSKQGYATTLMRFTQADKNVIDKAAAIMSMGKAPFMRMVLVEAATEVIRIHEGKPRTRRHK